MIKTIRSAAAAAGLLAALALPLASQAATTTSAQPQHYDMQTRMAERFHPGEYDGRLALTIYPNGIVQGTYLPSDGGVRNVTGGVTGTNIWLEIGSVGGSDQLRLTGTFKNGVLETVAAIPGPDTYTFESTSVKQTG
jgi:hypothetical protein